MMPPANRISGRNNRWQRVTFIVLTFGIAVLIVFTISRLRSFRNCVCKGGNANANNNHENQQCGFVTYLTCYGIFLEAHNGAVSAITGLLIAVFTGTLWWATKRLQDASTEQSDAMNRSIAESARAASAMEDVAKHFADNVETLRERTAKQMRAYICAYVNSGLYQERSKDIKFAGIPGMINTGSTPAYNVGYKAASDILPIPLPDDFAFPLPEKGRGAAVLGPHQTFTMNAAVAHFCDDDDVTDIMRARAGQALYIWGVITYEDIFGEAHSTKFCQIITWFRVGTEERINGFFVDKYNEAT